MCGIIGIARAEGIDDSDRSFIRAGARLMAHRGPDAEGTWFDANAGLGHRRLAVIDLSTGDQPMHDSTGRYTVVFNGEIYNFAEIRQTLEAKGHRFRTTSDTEVVVEAYSEWRAACVERFSGIFAFGVWDAAERSLFLARDHLGVKPLLYFADGRTVIFASELKAILPHVSVRREIDGRSLSDYLSLGYIIAPKTIFADIRKLPPASRMTWRDGVAAVDRYWDLASKANQPPAEFESHAEAVEALRAELDRVVRTQLVSDVPVGSFLSGGIDSSTVTQRMTRFYPEKVNTFSIGFPEASYSELDYARLAANRLGTAHHDQTIAPDLPSLLPRLAWFYDEPFADTSAVPTYLLCQFARSFTKVALSGDGGDECFAGYDTYLADKVHAAYRAVVPRFLHRCFLAPLARALPANHRKVSWNYKIKQFIAHAQEPPESGHYSWRLIFSEAEKREIMDPEVVRSIGDYTPFQCFAEHYAAVPDASPLGRALYVDAKTWLADAMLVKVDRASMASGLEVRVPLLDHKLVEFATALPPAYKLRGWRTKAILKSAVARDLPAAVVHRRKRGFNAPAAHWVRGMDPAMFRSDAQYLADQTTVVGTLLREHCSMRADNGFKLWTLMCLSQWHRSVIEN
jgi:asparagine synthase (glutamine-hydrolysing)